MYKTIKNLRESVKLEAEKNYYHKNCETSLGKDWQQNLFCENETANGLSHIS